MKGEHCTSGCRTKDHESYAACLRSKRPEGRNSTQSHDSLYSREAERDAVSREYRAARAQGIQPATTQLADIRHAVSASESVGAALTMRHDGTGVST